MVERDARSIAEGEDVRLTEGGGGGSAVVVRVRVDVRADPGRGPPGAPDFDRSLVPVGVGSVPLLRAVVEDPQGHHPPDQVAGVREAAGPFRGGQRVVADRCDRRTVIVVVNAGGDAGHAGDQEAAGGGGNARPPGGAVERLHAGADHLDVLVLGRSLGEPLELGDAASWRRHRAEAGGDRAVSGIRECRRGVRNTENDKVV
jgi:hypothetical protein